jgi:pimeloyl-ACP methyl ester carboxylesterase
VGYSGGGAIAVLVAARRSDVAALRTIAGNLDPKALCAYHNVSQLDGSMDPLDYAQKVARIPQRHFVGGNDKVVPVSMARSFVEKLGGRDDKKITIVNGASHTKGWQEEWPELLSMPVD